MIKMESHCDKCIYLKNEMECLGNANAELSHELKVNKEMVMSLRFMCEESKKFVDHLQEILNQLQLKYNCDSITNNYEYIRLKGNYVFAEKHFEKFIHNANVTLPKIVVYNNKTRDASLLKTNVNVNESQSMVIDVPQLRNDTSQLNRVIETNDKRIKEENTNECVNEDMGDDSVSDDGTVSNEKIVMEFNNRYPNDGMSLIPNCVRKVIRCSNAGCKFETKYNSVLKRHMIIHSGQRPYQCKYCQRAYAREDNLKNHMKVWCRKRRESAPQSLSDSDVSPDNAENTCQSRRGFYHCPHNHCNFKSREIQTFQDHVINGHLNSRGLTIDESSDIRPIIADSETPFNGNESQSVNSMDSVNQNCGTILLLLNQTSQCTAIDPNLKVPSDSLDNNSTLSIESSRMTNNDINSDDEKNCKTIPKTLPLFTQYLMQNSGVIPHSMLFLMNDKT